MEGFLSAPAVLFWDHSKAVFRDCSEAPRRKEAHGDKLRSESGGGRGHIPARLVLQAQRVSDSEPIAARAPGRHPLTAEYFIERYASKVGKKIRNIERKTLEWLQAYAWPDNIRELQNVVKRAVILCDGETFSIDETWLQPETRRSSRRSKPADRQASV
jgi:hypothetical protein